MLCPIKVSSKTIELTILKQHLQKKNITSISLVIINWKTRQEKHKQRNRKSNKNKVIETKEKISDKTDRDAKIAFDIKR